jgi:hypothetical protein
MSMPSTLNMADDNAVTSRLARKRAMYAAHVRCRQLYNAGVVYEYLRWHIWGALTRLVVGNNAIRHTRVRAFLEFQSNMSSPNFILTTVRF